MKISCLKVAVDVGVSKKKHYLLYTHSECNSCNPMGTLLTDCKNDLFFMLSLSRKSPPIPSCSIISPQSITGKLFVTICILWYITHSIFTLLKCTKTVLLRVESEKLTFPRRYGYEFRRVSTICKYCANSGCLVRKNRY